MFGALLLFAAASAPGTTTPALPSKPPTVVRATATATASIRIVSAVRFGPGQQAGTAGSDRRSTQLTEADGVARQAELLEFQ